MKNFMKKKSISTIFATLVCTAWMHAAASPIPFYDYGNKLLKESKGNFVTLYFHDLNSEFAIQQNVNEKGLVNIQGNFYKPITSSHVKLTIKYKDSQNNWIPVWCKSFAGESEYNEDLTASFELPASTTPIQNVKMELSSDADISNWSAITLESYNKSLQAE